MTLEHSNYYNYSDVFKLWILKLCIKLNFLVALIAISDSLFLGFLNAFSDIAPSSSIVSRNL